MMTHLQQPMRAHIIGRRFMPVVVAVIAVLLVTPILGACRGDDDDDAAPTVRVALGDWHVRPDEESVQAGQVAFVADNEGAVPHELIILKTGLHSDSLPTDGRQADTAAAGEIAGRIDDVPPGGTKTATFTLEPGRYVLLCNINGHYQAGMHADFQVTEGTETE